MKHGDREIETETDSETAKERGREREEERENVTERMTLCLLDAWPCPQHLHLNLLSLTVSSSEHTARCSLNSSSTHLSLSTFLNCPLQSASAQFGILSLPLSLSTCPCPCPSPHNPVSLSMSLSIYLSLSHTQTNTHTLFLFLVFPVASESLPALFPLFLSKMCLDPYPACLSFSTPIHIFLNSLSLYFCPRPPSFSLSRFPSIYPSFLLMQISRSPWPSLPPYRSLFTLQVEAVHEIERSKPSS